MTKAADAERAFRAFDWSSSPEWLRYYENLFPTPPLSKLDKYKRSWYRRNIDTNLPEAPKEPEQPKRATPQAGAQSSPPATGTNTARDVANDIGNGPLGWKQFVKLTLVNMEFYMLLSFLATGVALLVNWIYPFITKIQFENLIKLNKLGNWAAFIIGAIRTVGKPEFSLAYGRTLARNVCFQYLCYMISYSSINNKLPFIPPVVCAAIVQVMDLHGTYSKHLGKIAQLAPVKDLFNKLRLQREKLCMVRANAELALVPYLLVCVLALKTASFYNLMLYGNFLKLKIAVRELYLMTILKFIDDGISGFLMQPQVPRKLFPLYKTIVRQLGRYFNPEAFRM